jgi:diguanylate cyclase (GGDEF)-like protein
VAVALLSASLLVAAGIADHLAAREIGLEVFYLIPLLLAGWYLDRSWALGLAVTTAGLWLTLDVMGRPTLWDPFVSFWNGLSRLILFVGVAAVLVVLRGEVRRGRALARTDDLTGCRNPSAFYGAVRSEIERSRRSGAPFTVALFDVAGFDEVCRTQGRGAGERLLKVVAGEITGIVRATDVLSRLHDDVFAVLFPETARVDAGAVLLKISERVLREMRSNDWPTSLRMGAVTFETPPASVNELRRTIEDVQHAAREREPNVVEHQVVGADQSSTT